MTTKTTARDLEDCPQCDGTGSYGAGDDALCEWCDGRGRVTNAVYEAWVEEQDRSYRRGGPLL